MYMGYIFALIPPFLDSVINYLDKFLLSKYNISPTAITIYSGFFALGSGIVVFLLTGLHLADLKTALILTTSGFMGVFILLSYFKALTLGEASRVASLFQFNPILVLLLGAVILGESLLLKQYIGSFLIIVSGFMLSIQKLQGGVVKINKAFWYMVLASFFSAMVYISFKLGVKELGVWPAIPYEGLGSGLASLCILLYGNNLKNLKKEMKKISKKVFVYLTISEAIYRSSRLSFYFALSLIPAAIVALLQGFQPLFLLIEGIVLSLWFPYIIKEVVTKKTLSLKILAVFGIIFGLYLIFL